MNSASKREQQLEESAWAIALEIRDGRWDHLPGMDEGPAVNCPEIIDELRKRAPGFMTENYQRTIADALNGSK